MPKVLKIRNEEIAFKNAPDEQLASGRHGIAKDIRIP
jgi:hypothetical protein